MKPLISIVGTTGVGKSRLAIELALAIATHTRKHIWSSAKIINSDAMQAYVGADVLTNKVPLIERRGIAHLLMDFKDPGEQYVVGQWVNDAIQKITSLHENSILPIVVGGTAYWSQHLIFSNRLASLNSPTLFDEKHRNVSNSYSPQLAQRIQSLPPDLMHLFLDLPKAPQLEQASALHLLLTTLDPSTASRWHWKDTRKVLRSLELLKERGCLTSEVMAEQASSQTKPRYHTLIFWLYAEPDVLNPRLEARVDEMMKVYNFVYSTLASFVKEDTIKQGLVDEVAALRKTLQSSGLKGSEMPGIYQSIGFKEFADYISSEFPTQKQYDESVERTKISTRQYAKRQIHWIRNKLLPAIEHSDTSESKVTMYLLDATDLTNWQTEVHDVAVRLVHDFLENKDIPDPRKVSELANAMLNIPSRSKDPTTFLNGRQMIICEMCTTDPESPTMMTEGPEWQAHQRSRRHRRNVQRRSQLTSAQHPRKHRSPVSVSSNSDSESSELGLDFENTFHYQSTPDIPPKLLQ